MKYTKQYQNDEWLYTVWRAKDHSDYILVAVHPGVAWQNVAIRLTESEVETLRQSEHEFTTFVKQVVEGRNDESVKQRRIEKRIDRYNSDELVLV